MLPWQLPGGAKSATAGPGPDLLTAQFAPAQRGMENSGRPETGEFGPISGRDQRLRLTFRNLDVLREENL